MGNTIEEVVNEAIDKVGTFTDQEREEFFKEQAQKCKQRAGLVQDGPKRVVRCVKVCGGEGALEEEVNSLGLQDYRLVSVVYTGTQRIEVGGEYVQNYTLFFEAQ